MMDLPWLVGIPIWLGVGWAAFAWFEARALRHPERQHTLSRFVYNVGSKFPLSIALGAMSVGWFWGTLLTHFFWHFCPPGSLSSG